MTNRNLAYVGIASIEYVGKKKSPYSIRPGDFILTRDAHWTSKLIRFGQGLRFRGDDRRFAHWNHAALIETEEGGLIEAINVGVRRSNLDAYKSQEYVLVHVDANDNDRTQIVNFGKWCLGQPYGYTTIASIIFSLLTGGKFAFGFEGQSICSGLVARAEERGEAIFTKSPAHIMPADLAKYYNVSVP